MLAELPGRDLIGGDPETKIDAARLVRVDAGEERRGRARVVSRAVAERPPGDLRQPAEHVEVLAYGSSAFIVGLNSKLAPVVRGVHMNGRGLLSQAPTIPFGV